MNQMELVNSIKLLPEIELHLQELEMKLDRVVYLMTKVVRGHVDIEDIDLDEMTIPHEVYMKKLIELQEIRKLRAEERKKKAEEEEQKMKEAKEFMDIMNEANEIYNRNGSK